MADEKTPETNEPAVEKKPESDGTENFIVENRDVPIPQKDEAAILEAAEKAARDRKAAADKEADKADKPDTPEPEPKAKKDDKPAGDDKTDPKEAWDDAPDWTKKRVARESRKRREAEDRAAELQAEVDRLKQKEADDQDDDAPDTADDDADELNPDDFDTWDDYLAARDAKGNDAKKAKKPEKKKPEPPQPSEQEVAIRKAGVEPKEFAAAQRDLAEKVMEADPSLWDRMSDPKHKDYVNAEISPALVMSLATLDDPATVLAKLADAPEKAAEFSKMSAFQQARELAKLEAKEAPPPKKLVTEAEVIEPGGSGGGAPRTDPSKMSQAEFEEYRNKEERNTGGRFGFR